jgi:hypothetical protein
MRAVITAALTAAVAGLAIVQRSVELYPVQHEPHWINVPSNLRQMNDDDTPLEVLEAAATADVWLGASSASQPFNNCFWWYRLEIEVRRAGEPFTFEPTHVGDWVPRSMSKDPLSYPLVHLSELEPDTRYRWIARERVQPFTEFATEGASTECEPGALRESGWAWHHVPFNFSFRTR